MNRYQAPARPRPAVKKPGRWPAFLLAGLLAAILIVQISMAAQVSGHAKQLSRVDAQILELQAQKENLEVYLNMCQSIDRVKARAEAIGMVIPDETQIRVVSVPGFAAEDSAQTADNTVAETAMR